MSSTQTDAPHSALHTRLIWAGLFFGLAAFAKLPSLDLAATNQCCFTHDAGFAHAHHLWVRALYEGTPLIGRSILALLAVFALISPLLARLMRHQNRPVLAERCLGSWRRMAVVAVICGVLGPGLVIEVWFKNTVGRPRPVQVEAFGGDEAFRGALQWGGPVPEHHRSFVSSHAAAGFWLMSLGLTAGPLWRRRWLFIGLATGGLIGMGRMLQGGHFLSDIIFAFYAVWVPCEIVMALDRWQQRRQPQ